MIAPTTCPQNYCSNLKRCSPPSNAMVLFNCITALTADRRIDCVFANSIHMLATPVIGASRWDTIRLSCKPWRK